MKFATYVYSNGLAKRAGTYSYEEANETSEDVFRKVIAYYNLKEDNVDVSYRQDDFADEATAKTALDGYLGTDWDVNKPIREIKETIIS